MKNIQVEGIYYSDYPDFCDAYISYVEWDDGTPLTEEELEEVNNDGDIVYQAVLDYIY